MATHEAWKVPRPEGLIRLKAEWLVTSVQSSTTALVRAKLYGGN